MLDTLNKYHEEGLLHKQVHPTLPLTIWNYSETVQYNNLWRLHPLLLQCRGLVTDDKGNVVARPFRKFFNLSENKHTPTTDFEVYSKMDGSLGILFNYNGEWIMATRGSFTSDQSVKGFEMLQKYGYKNLKTEYTYLFEILYFENRIVVRYPFEDVVLLGIIETKTGREVDLYDGDEDIRIRNMINNLGFRIVEKYDRISDYNTLSSMIKDDEEGFVVRFSNGDRIKIKGLEYLRLHKIMTNVSTTGIWEVLSNGGNFDELLKDIPDEFYQKIKSYVLELESNYAYVLEESKKLYNGFYSEFNHQEISKKDFALWVMKQDEHLRPILFKMYDKKEYSSYIWKLIKPEFKKL
jgi:RNA ligase